MTLCFAPEGAMGDVVGDDSTELVSLRDMMLVVPMAFYRACVPAGHDARRAHGILPSSCPYRDIILVVSVAFYRACVPTGTCRKMQWTAENGMFAKGPDMGQISAERNMVLRSIHWLPVHVLIKKSLPKYIDIFTIFAKRSKNEGCI